jgi:hypothetical protein
VWGVLVCCFYLSPSSPSYAKSRPSAKNLISLQNINKNDVLNLMMNLHMSYLSMLFPSLSTFWSLPCKSPLLWNCIYSSILRLCSHGNAPSILLLISYTVQLLRMQKAATFLVHSRVWQSLCFFLNGRSTLVQQVYLCTNKNKTKG